MDLTEANSPGSLISHYYIHEGSKMLCALQVRHHSNKHVYTLMLHGGLVEWGGNNSSK